MTLPSLFPDFGDSIAAVVVSEDRILHVAERGPVDCNDGGEKFTDTAVHVELFDSDFNYIACLGRFRTATSALDALPMLADVARRDR